MKRKHRAGKEFVWAIETVEERILLSAAYPDPHLPAGYAIHPNIDTRKLQSIISANGTPGITGSATPLGLTPAQVRGAYGADSILFNGIVGDGEGQTIAIVDAYDLPNAFSDLQAFDAHFGLPDPPSFIKLNQQGNPSPLPGTDPAAGTGSTWEVEESLDIQWAHVIAPKANIILFEADDNSSNLYTAVFTAAHTVGVSVISMSWGGAEFSGQTQDDSTYFVTPNGHTPITFIASAGDDGIYSHTDPTVIEPNYPASSPNILSVGGTALTVSGNNYVSETTWGSGTSSGSNGGGGGGISQYEAQPDYQLGKAVKSTTQRVYPDVSMLADPATGVPIYDSFDFGAATPWFPGTLGGTSLAAPLWAGIIAIADQGRALTGQQNLDGRKDVLPMIYTAPSGTLHDITTGSNGYAAAIGYDLATGWGTPIANALENYLAAPALVGPYLGNLVWNDINGNGIHDPSELGLPGITVQLFSPGVDGVVNTVDDTLINSTTTTSTGSYLFSAIAPIPANYYVKFLAPTNYFISPQNQGTDNTINSKADPATGDTALIPVNSTTNNLTIDCGMFQQAISINDVSQTEGNSGTTTNYVFTVTITPAAVSVTNVPYFTSDGTATVADNDYIPTSGVLNFAIGVSSLTVSVTVIGDTKIENDEYFNLNITPPTGFVATKTRGIGTIINDDFPAAKLTGDYSAVRPDNGSIPFPFTIVISQPAPFTVSVPYSTGDGTAISGLDYTSNIGTAIFLPGVTSQTINVIVLGGTNAQTDKAFTFTITSSPTEGLGTPSTATGTIITNSPPGVTVSDTSVTESLTGVALMPFQIAIRPSQLITTTMDYTTVDGTAIAGEDYTAQSGTLTFVPGRSVQTVYVPVARRFLAAQDKTLSLVISNVSGGLTVNKGTGIGTIHDLSVAALTFDQNHKATYADYLGNPVTVSLRGPGSGTVIFLGTQSTATDAFEMTLDGTDATSSLTVKVAHSAQTAFTNVLVNGSLGSIIAKTSNIIGTVTTTGSLNSLFLNYVASSAINVGGGSGALAVNFSRVLDTSITSAIPISSLTAVAYLDTDGVPDYITAPSVGTVKVKGTFGGTIVTTQVASIKAGSLQGANILASNKIGTVVSGSITDSTLFAGITPGLTTLPTSASDFANQNARITSVKVKSGNFSNTQIASWKIGTVNLHSVQTTVTGADFGVSGNSVGSVTAFSTAAIRATKLDDPIDNIASANFVVRAV